MAKMYFVDPATGEVAHVVVKTGVLEARAAMLARGAMVNRFYFKAPVPVPMLTYALQPAEDFGWRYHVTYLGDMTSQFEVDGKVTELRDLAQSLGLDTKNGAGKNLLKAELASAITLHRKQKYAAEMIEKGTPVGWLHNHAFTCLYIDANRKTVPCPSCAKRAASRGICKHALAVAEHLQLHDPLAWYAIQVPDVQKKFYGICLHEWEGIFKARGHDPRYSRAYMPTEIPLPMDTKNGEVPVEEVQRNKELVTSENRKRSIPKVTPSAPPTPEEPPYDPMSDPELMEELAAMPAAAREVVLDPVAMV